MSVGVRSLTVLGEFKPFGLSVEASDGKPDQIVEDKYHYFLFDPEIARETDCLSEFDSSSDSCDRGDHELFIRRNRMIWSAGSQVHKRYTSSASIVMACWCHMDAISEPLLCVLQTDSLAIYNPSGEMVCAPLPNAITSIWPLPFGLLLQKATGGKRLAHIPFSSSSPLLSARDLSRANKEYGASSHYHLNSNNSSGHYSIGDVSTFSSHFILKHPLEEPQAILVEERGKLGIMKDLDESTIWTSNAIPLMASYHNGKMQHSVWLVEMANSNLETVDTSIPDSAVPSDISSKQFCLRRIWQGKCAESVAHKVFLATEDDGVPIICFLLQEQKALLAVRLQTDERNVEILVDIKPYMSWSVPAIAAAPVIVTRPRVKAGFLRFFDILVLSTENNLLLYSGQQCLCKYLLPSVLGKGLDCHSGKTFRSAAIGHDMKITGLADAVEGRINVIVNNGQMFRCTLRRNPSSSLANDCITAMAEGLHLSFYNHFVVLLWGDSDSRYLSSADSCVDSEWESFSRVLLKMCTSLRFSHHMLSDKMSHSSWEFLMNSKFHMNYREHNSIFCSSFASTIGLKEPGWSDAYSLAEETREKSFHAQILMETLDSLHSLYETLKLDNLRKQDLRLLVVLLIKIAASLGEANYVDHYIRDFPSLLQKFGSHNLPFSLRTPPCLFRWLESCLKHGCNFANTGDIPSLICKDGNSVVSWARKVVSFYSLLLGAERNGRKLSSGVYCSIAKGSASTSEELTVLAMVSERFGLQQLDLLPAGVSLPLRHALDKCRESPPNDWPAAAYVLIGREDLSQTCLAGSRKYKERESLSSLNLISISSPYTHHVHPVTVPSSISDMTGSDGVKIEEPDSIDDSMADGMENIFNSSTQLRFGRDLRLNEVRRLLCSAKPVAVQTSVNPSASDQELQQAQLWQLAQRTTTLPFGRGAFTLAISSSLLTEALVVPKLVLAGRLLAQQNATVNLDPNIRNMLELKTWPEFHNGVAAGLRLAPFQGKMSRTWIAYNKPQDPNVSHAGLLLALGLHGHLRVLTITDVFQYLSQEHDITTVGILLGMAASHRGTMHPAISRMLYLHIPSRHPASFPELELPTLLQSAALMAVGLLYEGSAHPLTMKILLGEIGRRSGGDNVLEREGYAVAAGSALGLVALGHGRDAHGLMDNLVARLFQYIAGGREVQSERFSNFPQTLDDQNRSTGQMIDGTLVNVDVTAPGATIALALMFLKTESEVVASRLSVPLTHFDLEYVRPDFIMLRVIARNMIMWSRVCPSLEWVEGQIPEIVKMGIENLKDETSNGDDMDAEALIQAYVNIITGACVSLGLKYAGMRNGDVQELLYSYAVYFLNEIKPVSVTSENIYPRGLLRHVDCGTLEICLHIIVLSLSVVMAGSGHIQTFRLLKYLRGRNSADGHVNYGIQMAVSLAIGFLFLGGGMQTFSTGNSAIAALLITLYPRLPTGPNDNRCHLQAFRHLYVLATEGRCVQTVDVDTGLPVYAPLEVTIRETLHHAETGFCEVTPCLLPERAVLKLVRVCGPRYWPQKIELVPEDKPWWGSEDRDDPFNGGVLYVKRKVGACSYVDDPIGCQSLLSRVMHKVCDTPSLRDSATNICSNKEPGPFKIDQVVSTFSADPSLIAFAQLCCDCSWNSRSNPDFQEFCLQVLFECVSKDRPALLQVYLSLYTTIGSMATMVMSADVICGDTLFLSSLKLALAYIEAVNDGKLSSAGGGIVQSAFVVSLGKRVEDIMIKQMQVGDDFLKKYVVEGEWVRDRRGAMLLSCYLQWFAVPSHHVLKSALERISNRSKVGAMSMALPSFFPLLHLSLPTVHIVALTQIANLLASSSSHY